MDLKITEPRRKLLIEALTKELYNLRSFTGGWAVEERQEHAAMLRELGCPEKTIQEQIYGPGGKASWRARLAE